ncbi:putative UDP-glucuronosyl/UDP-glucosyltransferase, UDP-glycosyltransferase family [Helianthus annuus]|nr:putative UDP-glucuronosyl/UDP-glucosyltransferase, UDP-glycosyltransferase family [Helianthus annuus]KAJ0856234.1 putative UDP-glucuronosyl/UDP-glucosyltransferase, UDP-glycosyltransferase family [Helianthus annuus]
MESAAVVLYPFPGMGHLVSMVELAKLIHIHDPSLSVNVFITPAPFDTTGSTENYINTVSAATPSINFHRFPTVPLPPDFSSDFMDLAFGIPELYNPIVYDTLVNISKKSTIKAVILDFFSNAAFRVSRSLNFPTYYFYTSGASGLCEFLYLPTIHNNTSKNIKDLDIYFDIPGVPPIHASDMPPVMFDRETDMYKNFIDTASNMAKSSGLIANSFVGLEERAVDAIRNGKCTTYDPTPPLYLIGPLIASGNQVDPSENECLKWLDAQPSRSVVFLCFGSMGVFEKRQLKEMAIGLMKSEQRFLWVVRDPPPDNENDPDSGGKDLGLDAILPEGFLDRTADKGLVVKNWAPQPAILSHDSVGGFVTHCGWNSTLEAVVAGVPMVAWPLYAEQKMNRVFLVEEMKVALAVKMSADGFVTAEAVEEKVRELIEGEEGGAVRERVLEMRRTAKAALGDGGSSRVDFLKLTNSWTDM